MSSTSVNTSLPSAFPESRRGQYQTPLGQKIEKLHTLTGLTAFERDFIAQLRSQPIVFADQLPVLTQIWQRHRDSKPATDTENVAETQTANRIGGTR